MKVICIDEKAQVNEIMHIIPFGEIVTVAGNCNVYPDSWDIKEYPVNKIGWPCSYYKKIFAPLSEIDELELIEQRLSVQHKEISR